MKKSKRPLIISVIALAALLLALIAELGVNVIEDGMHPVKYEEEVEKYSAEYNIPEYIVYAVINVESDFNPNASSGEANGLMQIAPATFRELTSYKHLGENLPSHMVFNPEVNIRYGCYYLRYLFEEFHNWNTVLAAYNAGPNRVKGWLESPEYSDGRGNLTSIPYKETANYVKKVNREIEYYKELYDKKQAQIQKEAGETK